MKAVVLTFITLIITALIGGIIFIYSGVFNVSARWEDPAILGWLLIKTRENSVQKRAQTINADELGEGNKEQIENGFRSYREMCVTCHSAPGIDVSPVAQGLNPEPPNLSKTNNHPMTVEETFWVIKNGIRMTGMPAWGVTHEDKELWDIVAFLKILPELSASDYESLGNKVAAGHAHGGSSESGSGGHESGGHGSGAGSSQKSDAGQGHGGSSESGSGGHESGGHSSGTGSSQKSDAGQGHGGNSESGSSQKSDSGHEHSNGH